MKRITDYRKLFDISKETGLDELKSIYRSLMKECHPDKFQDEALKEEAELKSKQIIEAYHFLVSISPDTHRANAEIYTETITNSGIDDFEYKGQTLKVTFQDGSVYEYFGVTKNTYNKLINAASQARFARRHIFESHVFRNAQKKHILV
jgi:DnaJ-class molecular chaperone